MAGDLGWSVDPECERLTRKARRQHTADSSRGLFLVGSGYIEIAASRELARVVRRLSDDGVLLLAPGDMEMVDALLETATNNYSRPVERVDRTRPGEPAKADWRTDWWRSFAILAALLYFTASVSAAAEFGTELLDELRDNAIVAIAIYGALREWNRRHGR